MPETGGTHVRDFGRGYMVGCYMVGFTGFMVGFIFGFTMVGFIFGFTIGLRFGFFLGCGNHCRFASCWRHHCRFASWLFGRHHCRYASWLSGRLHHRLQCTHHCGSGWASLDYFKTSQTHSRESISEAKSSGIIKARSLHINGCGCHDFINCQRSKCRISLQQETSNSGSIPVGSWPETMIREELQTNVVKDVPPKTTRRRLCSVRCVQLRMSLRFVGNKSEVRISRWATFLARACEVWQVNWRTKKVKALPIWIKINEHSKESIGNSIRSYKEWLKTMTLRRTVMTVKQNRGPQHLRSFQESKDLHQMQAYFGKMLRQHQPHMAHLDDQKQSMIVCHAQCIQIDHTQSIHFIKVGRGPKQWLIVR